MHFIIREPIWKNRSVGLDEKKLDLNNTVEITYKDRLGDRPYPFTYGIKKEDALKYPVMIVRGHKLRIVPISSMEIGGCSGNE